MKVLVKEPLLKRPFDFLLALTGIFVSLPIWFLIALAIYLEDGKPILFRQERSGKGGKTFLVLKFRTMKRPQRGEVRRDEDLVIDRRVTKVGKFLRVTALDELPALANILMGEMSFVGPRPFLFKIEDWESECYDNIAQIPGYEIRSQVRPGLAGLAQVYAPKDLDRRNKFRYDKLYVQHMSFLLDLKLLLLALWISLRGRWEHRGRKI